jgi:hypothetical protein
MVKVAILFVCLFAKDLFLYLSLMTLFIYPLIVSVSSDLFRLLTMQLECKRMQWDLDPLTLHTYKRPSAHKYNKKLPTATPFRIHPPRRHLYVTS